MTLSAISLANDIGTIAFAISGVYKGINKNLDALGISVLGFMTAVGGGVVRDILANRTPMVFVGNTDITFAIIGILSAFLIYSLTKKDISNNIAVKISDAVGLAAFTVIGATVGINMDFNIAGVIVLGVITGVGGGLISDILTLKIPMVLSEDFYATCSIIGASWLYIAKTMNLNAQLNAYIAFFIVLFLRTAAILFNWQLPKAKN